MNTLKYVKFPAILAAAAAVALTLTGCSEGHEVKLQVIGDGRALVNYTFGLDEEPKDRNFADIPDPEAEELPWDKTDHVDQGFNQVAVKDAEPGTVCRVYVDGELKVERTAKTTGELNCYAGTG